MNGVELAVLFSILLPLAGFVVTAFLDRFPDIRETITLLTGLLLLALTVFIAFSVPAPGSPDVLSIRGIVPGLPVSFHVEPLGAMFAVLASGLWFVNSLYSIGYMRGTGAGNQTRFYMCFALAISSVMGIAFSANLFTLFIFYEILTLSTFPLVTHNGNDAARRGGRIYLGILTGTSIALLLPAIVWTYVLTGTTAFTPGGIFSLHAQAAASVAGVLLALYVFGIGKAALMPVHSWLPAAMVAPTPVSAFLHAVAVVKAGVFAILKVSVYIFGIDFMSASGISVPFMWIAAISLLLASLIAMNQDNLKARLAFSTVSQLSYVTLGAMLAVSAGVMGGGMQIAAHALGKMTLFMCAGAIYVAHKKTKVSELRGMGRVMPFTFAAFFIGALSIAGLPPLAGSWPKFFLFLGSVDADRIPFVIILLVSSVLSLVYLVSIPVQAFMKALPGTKPSTENSWYDGPRYDGCTKTVSCKIQEAPFLCRVAIFLTASGTLVLFFLMDGLYDFLVPVTGKAF